MKKFRQLTAFLVVTLSSIVPIQAYGLNQFEAVKAKVFANPYNNLPYYKVNKGHFGKSGDHPENLLLAAARRTLVSNANFIDRPEGQKLLNANGICFAGKWQITQNSAYTGLFEQYTSVPVIARASVALTGTSQSDKRAFGLAIKFFPDAGLTQDNNSHNIFLLNSLVGVRVKHVLDLSMDNEPSAKGIPPWSQISTALRLRSDLERADKEHGTGKPQLAYRTVEHVAAVSLGQAAPVAASSKVVAPYWLRLQADEAMPRIDAEDFRNELKVSHYPNNQLVFNIEAASNYYPIASATDGSQPNTDNKNPIDKKTAQWQGLGKLVLTESVVSAVCDQQLHFSHPSTR